MENEGVERIKELFSKYAIYIFIGLSIIVLILLFLPRKEKTNDTPSVLTLTLKGNENVSIQKDELYMDAGYFAYDTKEGDLTSRVITEGYVNAGVVGSYRLRYYVINSAGKTAEAYRTVNVIADLSDLKVEINYEPKTLTNQDVTITLKVSGEGYDFVLGPDDDVYKTSTITYKAIKNDEYLFSIKRKDGNIIEKIVKVDNIDKKSPTGSCKGIITDNETKITVTASDESGISKYVYTLNNKNYNSTANSYTLKEIARNPVVTIYDKASNYTLINCVVTDNSWPTKTGKLGASTTPKYYYAGLSAEGLEYNLYYPDDLDLTKKNPLVVFLHGYGVSKISSIESTNFGKNMKEGRFKGAIFLTPKCGDTKPNWRGCSKNLINLIDYIAKKYNVDTHRISITGHSDGGAGTYIVVSLYPDKFSAAAIVAGAPGVVSVDNLKKTKMVVFYGSKDHNYTNGTREAESLQKKGVNLKLYVESGINHDQIPKVAYEDYNVIEWLISQSK